MSERVIEGRSGATAAGVARTVRLRVNGAERVVEAHAGETLLDLLRERCRVVSPKRGCAPAGQCGSCVALVGGVPHATCTIAADACEGKESGRNLWRFGKSRR